MKRSINTRPGRPIIRSACLNENGAALVIALMFIAILGMLGTTAYVMTTTDMQIGGNYKASVIALNEADAGVQEIIHRMNLNSGDSSFIGETPGTGPTPGWGRYLVLQTGANKFQGDPNWNLSTDSLDNDGDGDTDESGETYPEIATLQTIDGNELDYLVKAHYKIEDAQFNNGTADDEVVLYGQDFGYGSEAPVVGMHPVLVITSIGASETNSTNTTLLGEAAKFQLNINAKSALACDNAPNLGGATFISGFNHDITTTSGDYGKSTTDITGSVLTLAGNSKDNHGGKEDWAVSGHVNDYTADPPLVAEEEDTIDTNPNDQFQDEVNIPYGAFVENDQLTYLPGVWTTGDAVTQSGNDDVYGGYSLEAWKDEDAGNTWLSLALLLGITPEELQKILDKADVTMADTTTTGGNLRLNADVDPIGITYIDNASTGNALKFSSNTSGSGLMYVTGDMNANNLTFKGLIYVEGSVHLAGNFWLLGAMAVKGVDPVGTGGGQILYSKDALDYEVGNAMQFVFLSLGDESLMP